MLTESDSSIMETVEEIKDCLIADGRDARNLLHCYSQPSKLKSFTETDETLRNNPALQNPPPRFNYFSGETVIDSSNSIMRKSFSAALSEDSTGTSSTNSNNSSIISKKSIPETEHFVKSKNINELINKNNVELKRILDGMIFDYNIYAAESKTTQNLIKSQCTLISKELELYREKFEKLAANTTLLDANNVSAFIKNFELPPDISDSNILNDSRRSSPDHTYQENLENPNNSNNIVEKFFFKPKPETWIPIEKEENLKYNLSNSSSCDEFGKVEHEAQLTPKRNRTRSCETGLSSIKDNILRGFSPPLQRKTDFELDLKQLKAQEIRESILNEKNEKLKFKADKILAVREKREKEREQLLLLKETMEEKQSKAEMLRDNHLKNIQNKAKDEVQKRNEVAFITTITMENKKIDLQQRHETASATRLKFIQPKNRTSEREAATERRKTLEQERSLKFKADSEKKHELAVERLEKERLREAEERLEKKEEKTKRLEKFQSIKQAEEVEKQRRLLEKMELGAKRREETLEMVKEKAALANQQAKEVASRINEIRNPENKVIEYLKPKHEIEVDTKFLDSLSFKFLDLKRNKAQKRKLKKIRQQSSAVNQAEEKAEVKKNCNQMKPKRPKSKKLSGTTKFEKDFDELKRYFNFFGIKFYVKDNSFYSFSVDKEHCSKQYFNSMHTDDENKAEFKYFLIEMKKFENLIDRLMSTELENSDCTESKIELLIKICVSIDGHNSSVFSLRILSKCLTLIKKLLTDSKKNQNFVLTAIRSSIDTKVGEDNRFYEFTPNLTLEMIELLNRLLNGCNLNEDFRILSICEILTIMSLLLENFNFSDYTFTEHFSIKLAVIQYLLSLEIIDGWSKLLMVVHGDITSSTTTFKFLVKKKLMSFSIEAVKKDDCFKELDLALKETINKADFIPSIVISTVSLVSENKKSNFVNLKDQLSQISLSAFKCLNYLSIIDLKGFQNVLSSDGILISFFHLISIWLKFLIKNFHSITAVKSNDYMDVKNLVFFEILVLIGRGVIFHPVNRSMLRFTVSNVSILDILLKKLPFEFFINPLWKDVLFPTLIAAGFDDEDNRFIMKEEINFKLLTDYVEDNFLKPLEKRKLDVCNPSLNYQVPLFKSCEKSFFEEVLVQFSC
ncbi:hypothetical protein HDU92_003052 [Lobulomyces angularis]|nr:hypothetical protein HDU92_003052 [Lobulomyces angularis]